MKYLPIILVILFVLIPGCLESSAYKDVSRSQLLSDPAVFEGKKICTDLIYENNSFPGINVIRNQNFTSDLKNATLATVCGIYRSGQIEPDSVNPILAIATQKDVYYSNETLRVHIDFYSKTDGNGNLGVSGIRNDFDRPLINKTQDITFVKGINGFDLEFTTPSCEECSALSPGEYAINATATVSGKTFETYKKVILARNDSNISKNGSEILQSNNTVTNEQLNNTRINDIKAYDRNASAYGTQSNETVLVEYFYITGCQKCEQATPVVEALMKSYGSRVNFVKYNAKEEGRDLAIQYGIPGTPSIVINKDSKNLISYDNYNGDTAKLENILKEDIDKAPVSKTPGIAQSDKLILSVPSIFVVGFLAGFNPCLLAILAFIASVTLATTGKRRNVLLIVLMFSLGIFVTYLIVGIGLLRILEEAPGLQAGIKNFLVVLIGILGLWHVYDANHLRKNTESSFYTPKAFIRLTESVTKKVSLPASFFMGALFSLIKAPCVGAVYFLILDMVRKGEGTGYLYLAAYNFGVVLPVLVLGGAIAFGLDPEKVEKFRKDKRVMMRLVTGVTLLAIAVLMYMGII
ncbi:Cytochrome C biogenesis protein transmembrane region [uncultured archaeon]|nr:Cytochrome C biogenesis protein transmembrane region [uncultured archaeon]